MNDTFYVRERNRLSFLALTMPSFPYSLFCSPFLLSRVDLGKHLSTFIYIIFHPSLCRSCTLNYLYHVLRATNDDDDDDPSHIHLFPLLYLEIPLTCVPSYCERLIEHSSESEWHERS